MRIGIDLHKTITKYPNFFRFFTRELMNRRNIVYIITGSKRPDAFNELKGLGFVISYHYHYILSVTEFISKTYPKLVKIDDEGNYWIDDDRWWSSKYLMCCENKINYMIDDSMKYGKYFDFYDYTRFIHFDK